MIVAIFVRIICSWKDSPHRRDNQVHVLAFNITEPVLAPVRDLFGGGGVGGLDFSLMIVSFVHFMIIGFAKNL